MKQVLNTSASDVIICIQIPAGEMKEAHNVKLVLQLPALHYLLWWIFMNIEAIPNRNIYMLQDFIAFWTLYLSCLTINNYFIH